VLGSFAVTLLLIAISHGAAQEGDFGVSQNAISAGLLISIFGPYVAILAVAIAFARANKDEAKGAIARRLSVVRRMSFSRVASLGRKDGNSELENDGGMHDQGLGLAATSFENPMYDAAAAAVAEDDKGSNTANSGNADNDGAAPVSLGGAMNAIATESEGDGEGYVEVRIHATDQQHIALEDNSSAKSVDPDAPEFANASATTDSATGGMNAADLFTGFDGDGDGESIDL